MKTLRTFTFVAVAGLALATAAGANPPAPAGPGCANCAGGAPAYGGGFYGGGGGQPTTLARHLLSNHQGGPNIQHRGERIAGLFHRDTKPKLPVFQAAPWYNYWPYDGHFLTPAPVNGQFYGPPMTGNFPVNPFFPGPGLGGFGGPIPGGPPPGFPVPMPK